MNPGNLRDAVDVLTEYDHGVVQSAHRPRQHPGVVNGRRLGQVSLVFVAYGSAVSVLGPPAQDQLLLVLPMGPMGVEVSGRRSTQTSPFLLPSASDTTMYPDPAAGALVGAVQVEMLTDVLREVFGAERMFSVDLTEARPLPLSASTALRRSWLEGAEQPDLVDSSALIDSLAIGLVPYTSYRESERLDWARPPAYLFAAVRHLRRHFAEPVSIAQLGESLGIGSRQLQMAFKAHLGCTAQEYLMQVRLDRAWVLLRNPVGQKARTVAAVGAEVGIPHQGRFAQYFLERFQELPSALR